jgi:hypothetical protein
VAVVPDDVGRVVGGWRSAGSPAQDGIAWTRQRWIDQFTQFAPALTMLPDRLDRSVIRDACRRAAASAVEAEQAFLAVMAWGYGRVGYGPYRVRRLFDVAPDAGAHLQAAAGVLAEQGPVAAYARLGDHGVARLAGLGPLLAPSSCTSAPLPAAHPRSFSTGWWRNGFAATPTFS